MDVDAKLVRHLYREKGMGTVGAPPPGSAAAWDNEVAHQRLHPPQRAQIKREISFIAK